MKTEEFKTKMEYVRGVAKDKKVMKEAEAVKVIAFTFFAEAMVERLDSIQEELEMIHRSQ